MSREAFEKWALSHVGTMPPEMMYALVQKVLDGTQTYGPLACAWAAWQACSEHYEAVMRRAVVFAWMRSTGKGPQAEDVDDIIKRAREEG